MKRLVIPISILICCVIVYIGWEWYTVKFPNKSDAHQEPTPIKYGSDLQIELYNEQQINELQSSVENEESNKNSFSQGNERVVDYVLEPLEHPDSAGFVNMIFSFHIKDDFCRSCQCCNEIPIEVITNNGLKYIGTKQWIAYPSQDKERFYSKSLQIIIPPNDTSSLRLELKFGQSKVPAVVYFVTTGDLVEFWKGYPSGRYWKYPKFEPDTTKYEIRIDLQNPKHYEIIKHFVDSIGPIRTTLDSGIYIIKVTQTQFDKLKREGFKCEYIKNPPLQNREGEHKVKINHKKIGTSSEKNIQIPPKTMREDEASIWLDHVVGEDENGRLPANQLIRFVIGFANHTGESVFGITNGFRIYSPDGAVWDTTIPETIPPLEWSNAFDGLLSFYYKSLTGYGADSIKLVGITVYGSGLQYGFDDTAIALTIGPIDPDDVGKTICIDSSYVSGSSNWYWSSSDGMTLYYPTWFGPFCFEVTSSGYIYFYGQLRYTDPTPPDTVFKSIREATIYMWDEDLFGSYQFLDSAVTDNSGYFSIGPVSNNDAWGLFGQDVFFTFYAMNNGTYVTDSLNGPVQMIITETLDDVDNGDHESNIDLTIDESKSFFVADVLLDGYKKWKQSRPNPADLPGGPVQVVLKALDFNTLYSKSDWCIYINDSIDVNQRWPHTWNKSTILHEYAHRIGHMNLFFRDGGGSHTLYGLYPVGLSSSEGWAHFWSAHVLGSQISMTYWNEFYDSTWFNLENGEYDLVPRTGSVNAMTKYNEGAIAGMLWDIYDSNDDDYSSQSDWGDTTLPHTPNDGRGDTLYDGIDNILTALMDNSVYGHRPDNIDEFWFSWFASVPFPSHGVAMGDIWYEHGELAPQIPGCCNGDGKRGNVDGQGTLPVVGVSVAAVYRLEAEAAGAYYCGH